MEATPDYFFCPPPNISGDEIVINGDEFAHLVHVMRKKAGDHIRTVDGAGVAYDVILEDLKKHTAHGRITSRYPNHHEPAIAVTLAVGVLKNPSRFDFLVEKATELGVREIVPLKTARVIPHHGKTERWQKLALAAMKQCCRSYLPVVRPVTDLDEFLSGSRHEVKLIAHEKYQGYYQPQPAAGKKSAGLLVGPEGGFSEEEVERCIAGGFQAVSLGERRLRTETAAAVLTFLAMGGNSDENN
ncbi:MAG TPA: RsmE family RNA methyltransferase [Bacteroidota bacterium]|nr:RsmE family RNA methyltransferase [Bacteroidota bacterium]